jgi:hypothetical protein
MDNIFLVAALISIIFFIAKFLEMRYVDNEPKPLKLLIRDTLVVYISVILGYYIVDQLKPVIHESAAPTAPVAFTDNPPF